MFYVYIFEVLFIVYCFIGNGIVVGCNCVMGFVFIIIGLVSFLRFVVFDYKGSICCLLILWFWYSLLILIWLYWFIFVLFFMLLWLVWLFFFCLSWEDREVFEVVMFKRVLECGRVVSVYIVLVLWWGRIMRIVMGWGK